MLTHFETQVGPKQEPRTHSLWICWFAGGILRCFQETLRGKLLPGGALEPEDCIGQILKLGAKLVVEIFRRCQIVQTDDAICAKEFIGLPFDFFEFVFLAGHLETSGGRFVGHDLIQQVRLKFQKLIHPSLNITARVIEIRAFHNQQKRGT